MSAAPTLSIKNIVHSDADDSPSELGVDLDNMRNTIHAIDTDSSTHSGRPCIVSTNGSDAVSNDGSCSPTASTSSKNSPPPSTTSSKSLNVQRKSISHAHSQTSVKTPPSTWFKPRMKRIKISSGSSGGSEGVKGAQNQRQDSQLVSFVKSAFMAFDNSDKEEYAAYFSSDLKCTINALPYTVDGLKDVYNYITSTWVTTVEVNFKHVVEHPRLMGKWGEGEVGAVAELSGRDIFGQRHSVDCLFTMIVVVNEHNKQQIKDYVEVMSYDS